MLLRWGVPFPSGVPPCPDLGRGCPHQLDEVPPCPDLGRGYPLSGGWCNPLSSPGKGYPPTWEGVPPVSWMGFPHQLDGVPPISWMRAVKNSQIRFGNRFYGKQNCHTLQTFQTLTSYQRWYSDGDADIVPDKIF